MDYDTNALLGALYDDELAGLEDELQGFDVDDNGQVLGAFNMPSFMQARQIRTARRAPMRRGSAPSSSARHSVISRINQVQAAKAAYINKIQPAIPGVPGAGARNFPLGFGSFVFVNAGVTAVNLTALPQRPFKGARLVVDVRRSAGALAELVSITSLNIGQNNQLVSSASLPAEAFRPDGFDTVLSLDPATPGITITLGIALSAAPGVGETIAVSAMIIGDTIG